MKKSIVLLLLCLSMGGTLSAVNENVVVWEEIYRQAPNDDQRYVVMLKIASYQDRDFAPMIYDAFVKLAARRLDIGTPTEINGKVQLARLMVRELGNLKYIDGADILFGVYKETKDSVLKAEAAVALGRMRATSFAEQLALDLNAINIRPSAAEQRQQETVAFGLVQGLEAMRAEVGFAPVFLAAYGTGDNGGWYSTASGVKEVARTAVTTMVDDPGASLLNIVGTHPSLEVKTRAVEAAMVSRTSDQGKAAIASLALRLGVDRVSSDLLVRRQAEELRKVAMSALVRLGDRAPANAEQLKIIVTQDQNNDTTLDETLRAYVALGKNGSDPAIAFLVERITFYNRRQASGANSARDKIVINEIVSAMRETGSPKVKTALELTINSNHDNNIRRNAETSLKQLP